MNEPGKIEIIRTTPKLSFLYVNYEGKQSIRNVSPLSVRFGTSDWHAEPQWLMAAWDMDRCAHREFAMKDMTEVIQIAA